MLSSISFVVSYGTVRVVVYVMLTVLFAVFFVKALMGKRLALRVLCMAALFVFIAITALVPVENLFVRFPTPAAAIAYSMPNEPVVTVAEHDNRAVVIFEDRKMALLRKDSGGWMTVVPGTDREFRRGTIQNIAYYTRRLDAGLDFICVFHRKHVNPENNAGNILIDTITDSRGSSFVSYAQGISWKEIKYYDDIFHWTFTDASDPGYHLVINGQDRYLR